MVSKYGSSTDGFKEGGLGRCENADHSDTPGKDARGDGSDNDDEKDPEEDPEEEINRTETQSGV